MRPHSVRARATVLAALLASFASIVSPATAVAHALGASRLAALEPDPPPVIGVVRDSAGAPLANARVVVSQLNRVTTTDATGTFTLRGLPAGTYHLSAARIGYAPGHADISVPQAGPDVHVTITLGRSAVELSTVQVTATPTGTDPRTVAQSTTELAGQALARNLGATVAQTLASEPGVSLRFNGPAATAPVIRGLQGERILVLQDGERAGDLSSSAPDHGVTVDPLSAERIEVVRGPASLLYGNNALGGVVNVISNDIPTAIPSRVEGYLGGQTESASPGGTLGGGVTVPLGRSLALVGRAGGRRVDDYRQGGIGRLDNTYFRNQYGVGGIGFGGSRVTGGVAYRGYGFDYGLPSADDEGAHIEGNRHEVSGRADVTTGGSTVGSVRVSGTAQWYTHDEVARDGDVNTSFDLKTQTADVLARTRVGPVTGAVGASGLFKAYASTGEEALTPAANSVGLGAFIYQEVPLGALSHHDALVPRLQLGGRFDRYRIESKTGDEKFGPGRTIAFNNVSGSVGVSVPLGGRASVAVSAARAFRAPSVEELFSNAFHEASGTFDRGNPSLRQEINQGVDGIVRVHSGRVSGQIGGYWSRVANFITPDIVKDTIVDGDEGLRSVPLNQFSQADATLKGLEGRIEAEVAPRLVVGAMGDLVRGEFRDSKEPLPFMPPARLGALARWDNGTLSFGAEVRHAFAQNRVPPAVSEDDPSGIATDAYTLVELNAGYNITLGGRVSSIVVRVDNLTDVQYRDAASRIKHFAWNPGRNISVVYKVAF